MSLVSLPTESVNTGHYSRLVYKYGYVVSLQVGTHQNMFNNYVTHFTEAQHLINLKINQLYLYHNNFIVYCSGTGEAQVW